MALLIHQEVCHDYTLIQLHGSLDATNTSLFATAISQAESQYIQHIVVDCNGLDNITSDGLGTLLECYCHLASKHLLILCRISESIGALMKLTGISRYIPQFRTIEEAEIFMMESDAIIRRLCA